VARKRKHDRHRRRPPAAPAPEPRVEWVEDPASGHDPFTQDGFLAALAQLLCEARDREPPSRQPQHPAPPGAPLRHGQDKAPDQSGQAD
jgi:hypothetical protein